MGAACLMVTEADGAIAEEDVTLMESLLDSLVEVELLAAVHE